MHYPPDIKRGRCFVRFNISISTDAISIHVFNTFNVTCALSYLHSGQTVVN